ncbi:hypothetical protein [Enterococcus sp. LJL51]|uniref:hypothetical protein n=1 Tax=Enterococcus sp. LJL51 TaxID=3416656 RepID=UPI003CE8266C
MEKITYEIIKEDVRLSFEEYIDEHGYSVDQATANVIEEFWRNVNKNQFIRYSYFIRLGIESLQRKEIADFLHKRLSNVKVRALVIRDKEIKLLKEDIEIYKRYEKAKNYKIINAGDSERINYLLNLKHLL